MNIENLKRAQEFISGIHPEKFCMYEFRDDFKRKTPECDSVGCIIGHCTALDIDNVMKNHRFPTTLNIDFDGWGREFFDLDLDSVEGRQKAQYLFASSWADDERTNTPEHAVYRIQKIIDGYQPGSISCEIKNELKLIK